MTTTIIKTSTGNTVTVFELAGSAFTWQAVNQTWASWTAVKAANALWSDVRDA